MFTPNVISLRQFYSTALGAHVAACVGRAVQRIWPSARGEVVVGIGYCLPYLELFRHPDNTLVSVMPAVQGAVYWPAGSDNRTVLASEAQLPLPGNMVNRVMVVHAMEASEHLHAMLEEVWRVLTPGGRMLVVVPNRLSLWSRLARSPFGYGRPFSTSQLKTLLTEVQFTITDTQAALFVPPLRSQRLLKLARILEWCLLPLAPFLGGVMLVEAEKQIYAAIREPVTARNMRPVMQPSARPAMSINPTVRR